jgi:hypothetical protein
LLAQVLVRFCGPVSLKLAGDLLDGSAGSNFDLCDRRILVLTGTVAGATAGEHILKSDDGKAALWLGNVDDLFHFGGPRGVGGPWKDTAVRTSLPSDPYLMCGYNDKVLALSQQSSAKVTFTVQVDVDASGNWHDYEKLTVAPGRTIQHRFPNGFSAHWVRLVSDRDTTATATFTYA